MATGATQEIVTLFKADLSDLEAGVAKATATLKKYEDFSEGAAASGNNLSSSVGSLAAKTATLGAVQQKYIQSSQEASRVSVIGFKQAGAAADAEAKRVENLTAKMNELRAAQGQNVAPQTTSGPTTSTTPRPAAPATTVPAQPNAQSNIPELHQEALALIGSLEGVDQKQKEILSTLVTITAEYENIRANGEQFPGQLDQLRQRAVETLGVMTGLTAEEVKLEIEAIRAEEAFERQNRELDKGPKKVITLQQQLRKARQAAADMVAQFGQFHPRAIEAVKGAARLKEEIDDTNASIQAFNPEQKFRVVAQLGQNVAGGFTAAQGALTALGIGGEGAAEALAKVQGLLAVTQGLDAFAGIGDSLKNFIALLKSSNAVQVASTAVTEADIVAKGAQKTAIVAETAVTNTANVATKAWTASLLANPFVLAAAAIALTVTAIIAFNDETELAKKNYDDFVKSLNQDLESDLKINDQRERINELNRQIAAAQRGGPELKADIIARNSLIEEGIGKDIDSVRENGKRLQNAINEAFALNNPDELKKLEEEQSKNNDKQVALEFQKSAAIKQSDLDLLNFQNKQRDEAQKKAEEASQKQLQLQQDLNNKLLAAEKQFRLQSLPENERAVQQVNDQFDPLVDDAKKIKNAEARSATLQRIENDREKAISAVLFEQLKARQKAGDDYIKEVENAALELKNNAVAIEEARWDGVIEAATIRGEERVSFAKKNGLDVAKAEEEVADEVSGLKIDRERSLLAARFALIEADSEARRQKARDDAEADFAIADAAGESTVERQVQLGEQIAQIDAETAQQRIDTMAMVDAASAEFTKSQADRIIAQAQQEQAIQQQRLQTVGDFFGSVSQLAEQQSTEQKALQTTQALINTYAGVAAVFGNPVTIGPPPVDLAFRLISAAAVVANGIAAVRRIQGAYHGEEFIGETGRPDRPGRDGYLRWTHYGERVVKADDNREHFGLLSAMHKGKLDEFIDANYVMPAINKYLASDDGQRVTTSVMMAPYYDANIVKALDRGRKTQDKTNEILLAMMKQQPRVVVPNRRMWN